MEARDDAQTNTVCRLVEVLRREEVDKELAEKFVSNYLKDHMESLADKDFQELHPSSSISREDVLKQWLGLVPSFVDSLIGEKPTFKSSQKGQLSCCSPDCRDSGEVYWQTTKDAYKSKGGDPAELCKCQEVGCKHWAKYGAELCLQDKNGIFHVLQSEIWEAFAASTESSRPKEQHLQEAVKEGRGSLSPSSSVVRASVCSKSTASTVSSKKNTHIQFAEGSAEGEGTSKVHQASPLVASTHPDT